MSLLSNINPTSFATQAVLAAGTGGTSLAVNVATKTMLQSAAGQALTTFAQSQGLPQSAVSSALASLGNPASITDSAASVASELGLTPFEQGSLENSASQASSALGQMLLDGIRHSSDNNQHVSHGGGKGGESLLVAMAEAMGSVMDQKLNQMFDAANQLGDLKSSDSQYGELSSKIQAWGQELSMVSNAASNSIKSIGEAGSTLAKKD